MKTSLIMKSKNLPNEFPLIWFYMNVLIKYVF